MAGSSNFQQWNPNSTNQETDSQYTSDSQRSGGAANPSTFASATANKLFYQLSTFVTAFATMMANKGYTLSDANLANLEAVLTNVITAVDLTAYAPKASPAFSGTPTVPTPAQGTTSQQIPNAYWVAQYFAPLVSAALQGAPTAPTPTTADNSTKLATTAFVKAVVAAYQTGLGFTPVQQSGGAAQLANKVYIGWDGGNTRIQIDSSDQGAIAMQSWVNAQAFATQAYVTAQNFANVPFVNGTFVPLSSFALGNPSGSAAYYRMPDGLILQFGQCGVGTATSVTLPVAFATGFYQVTMSNIGPGGGAMNARILGQANVNSSSFKVWCYDQTGAASSTNISWIAIGY